MARKSKNNEEGVNLDSLMDALTNVVAVLILVLVLVQADVTQKVAEFLEDLEPATPEEVQESKEALAELKKEKEDALTLLNEEPPSPEEIEAEKRKIALLEKKRETQTNLLADLAELKSLEEKVRKKRDEEKEETLVLQEEIQKLEATLDNTKAPEAIPATEITIPSSRPIPEDALKYYAIVSKDRVHFIDPFSPEKEYIDLIKKNRSKLAIERIAQKGADRYIYDQEKIVTLFEKYKLKNNRNQSIRVPGRPTSRSLYIEIIPDLNNGGSSIDELRGSKSIFKTIINKLASDKNAIVLFLVNTDGFETYLEARKIADRYKVPAGWQISGAKTYRHHIPSVEVNQLSQPVPRPPNPNPKPTPPKIGPKLD